MYMQLAGLVIVSLPNDQEGHPKMPQSHISLPLSLNLGHLLIQGKESSNFPLSLEASLKCKLIH